MTKAGKLIVNDRVQIVANLPSRAVVIVGKNAGIIAITPTVAREIAQGLTQMAAIAEGVQDELPANVVEVKLPSESNLLQKSRVIN